jgi:hypothetical protein
MSFRAELLFSLHVFAVLERRHASVSGEKVLRICWAEIFEEDESGKRRYHSVDPGGTITRYWAAGGCSASARDPCI